jgi:hypothetical protein
MTVRAKFTVMQKTESPTVWIEGKGYTQKATLVTFSPVYASPAKDATDRGNACIEKPHFWRSTPSGKIEMLICNQAAADGFETGRSYYVDFTPADSA